MDRDLDAFNCTWLEDGSLDQWVERIPHHAALPVFNMAVARATAKKPRRRSPHVPHDRGIRALYDRYLEMDCDVLTFARYCGVSSVTIWSWFGEMSFPRRSNRDKIFARTGIDIQPPRRKRR